MTLPWRLGALALVIGLYAFTSLMWYRHGYKTAATASEAHHVTQANVAWMQRFTLESQLATRDAQLVEAQQAASEDRQKTVTVREVIYRDRIKVRTVRDCVDDSGLFELYNSTLGITGGQQ